MWGKTKKLLETWWYGSSYGGSNISNEITDDEVYGWKQLGREAKSWKERYINEITLEEIRDMSRYLYLTNAHYRGILRQYRKYIAGKPLKISGEQERENKIWKVFQKRIKWRKFFKEAVLRFFRDGEVFLYIPTWQFLDPNNIIASDPNISYGIETNPDNVEEVLAYWYRLGNKEEKRIEVEDILHIKESDSDEKRGIPYLLAIMAKTEAYDKWLGDRILLNRIRASIAIIRKHDSGPAKVKTFADSKATSSQSPKDTSYGESLRKQIFEPGTIIDCSKNTEYQYLEPKVQAKDVAEDGRHILLSFSAATGLPEFMVTGDASNSNYASTMVAEGPGIREFEDWQDFFSEIIQEIWAKVMEQNGLNEGGEPQTTIPSLVTRNQLEEAKVNEILLNNGIISVDEWRRQLDVDTEKMEKEINGDLKRLDTDTEKEDIDAEKEERKGKTNSNSENY